MTARFDGRAFAAGAHHELHKWFGAHDEPSGGYRFAVWAPRAAQVSVVGSWGTIHRLRRSRDGVWRGRAPAASPGDTYRYEVETKRGTTTTKADPFARQLVDPSGPDGVLGPSRHRWRDVEWMRQRAARQSPDAPISVYEVHLGSWQRSESGTFLGYRETGRLLAEYATTHGFTHIELLPVAEHPFYGSWGYQSTGYFAPTGRYGTQDDFKAMIDTLHRAGIGVILDWVPSHFATDPHALGRFDGYPLYEHRDRRRGFHPDWQSHIFDYGKGEVRSFLLSNASFWLEEFHIDGLRVDAVASMLHLDFSRKAGEWVPNRHGGNAHLEAIGFLQDLTTMIAEHHPGALTIAEESSAWPGVTAPTDAGGLGFDLKWDMGWMHDTLRHFQRPPESRSHHATDLSFRMLYAFDERFMLALSHDEVVYEKASLIGKMPGSDDERFANLRCLLGYQWALPGKKLIFMGDELAQWNEWNHDVDLDWELLQWKPHRGIQRWVADLNGLMRSESSLHQGEFDPGSFRWIQPGDRGLISFARTASEGRSIVFVSNLSHKARASYRLGVPQRGRWKTLLNSDTGRYGGEGRRPGPLSTRSQPAHDHEQSLVLDIPPLTSLFLTPVTPSGSAT